MPGLFARPIDFQVTHHDMTPPPAMKIDERVRDEHPADRVQHIGIVVAVGDEQQCFRIFHSGFRWRGTNVSQVLPLWRGTRVTPEPAGGLGMLIK